MSEVVANLDYTLIDQGIEYYVNVAAEPTADAQWEAWLEFVPLDDSDPLLTGTETVQASRGDVAHWAATLGEAYVQGAFERALLQSVPISRTATRVYEDAVLMEAPLLDPFEVLQSGKDVLRMRLRSLTRAELLTIIARYNLNPARLSVARLSESQLVTFIATATEVQALQGNR
jgi:hypothetical protein